MRRPAFALFGTLALLLTRNAYAQTTVTRSLQEEVTRTSVWMVIAAVLFAIAYKVVDFITPGDLKTQLAEGNTALAIFAGSVIIAAAIIIAHLVG